MKNNTQEEPLFLPAPFFMVRFPLLPIDYFLSFLQEENPHQVLFFRSQNDPLFREAISIASPALYKALGGGKETPQIASSLLKYFTRMCSRPTPFGLFSCVSLGEWEKTSSAVLDLKKIYKRARPDMEWLSLVIDQLHTDFSLIPYLSVKKNALLFESGGRAFLQYVREKNKEDEKKAVSIRLSFLTRAIFELTKDPISIEELKKQIILRFPSLDKEKVHGVIEKLLQEQFLSFALRPSLLQESPFAALLSQLSSISSIVSPLKEVAAQIKSYNEASVGQGEDQLQKTQGAMEKIVSSPNFLQVDAGYKGEKITLPEIVAKELQESVELLWKVSCTASSYLSLKSYHENFLDKYGTCRTIPLFELLNEDGGLGIPESYSNTASIQPFKGPKQEKWERWLQKQWAICLKEKKQEIELDEKVINEICGNGEKENALLSFDLRCEIIANSSEEINKEEFLLQISPFAWQGGATFGRFVDMLGTEAKEKLQAFFREEEALDRGSFFTEASYQNVSFPRSANVMIQPNLRNHSIDLEGGGTVSLDDIYIGATIDRLYVTLKDGLKELKVISSNMMNPTSAPAPLRFIREVSNSKYLLLHPFSWMGLSGTFFLPRVCYKKTIFSPAEWKVDLLQLNSTSKETIDIIEEQFCQWANTWEMPRYVFMTEEDSYLLLDRRHPSHLRVIALEIKKGKNVRLIEKIGQTKGQWLESQKGVHLSEFVIPFVKNKKYSSPPHKPITTEHYAIPAQCRWKLPGSEWLFVKYYLGIENQNLFLIEQCSCFAQPLLERGIIAGWFFVRYADPKPHLRLRFHGEKELMITQLIPAIHEWALALLEGQAVQEMTLSTYEREIERYGGEELMESTEALFCADTETAILLIHAMIGKKTKFPEEVIASLSMIDLLKGFGLTLKEQVSFFSALAMDKEELAGFRKWKSSLLSLGEAILEDRLALQNDTLFLHEAFQKRTSTLETHARKLREMEEKQKLMVPPNLIYDSILHMHCNRLTSRFEKEKKARLYAFQTLTILQEKQERLNMLSVKSLR